MLKGVLFPVFLLLLLPMPGFSEGTKQFVPHATAEGQLCIDKYRNDFGFFNAAPEFRINIHIASLTEKFYFGLGAITRNDTGVVRYQVKDPAGNIVIGPAPVPVSGQGYISSYDQDTIGPFVADSGYNPLQHIPAITGDYSLEFFYPPDQVGIYTISSYMKFKYFDITVVDAANHPIQGRVWSKAWQFNCGPVEPPPLTNSRFYGTMFVLSDDSIVTSVNCNGFIGGTFSISSNRTGCSATGNIAIDRQSRTGFHTYPQYKIFLSDPDSTIFPTGKANPGIIMPITINNNCAAGSVDLGVKVTQDGIIEILVEVDPKPGVDPRDVKLTSNVYANPGGNGYNIIRWNGKDGLGKPVANGVTASSIIRFIHGITHLPIYDIEYNDRGYIVEVIRPPGQKPDMYWDDSLLPDSTSNLSGCNDVFGCHFWDMATGDTNTVNSWWYVASSTAPAISFTVKRTPGSPGVISGDKSFCEGGVTRTYFIRREPNSSSYNWSYSGTGVTLTPNDTSAIVSYDVTATSGTLAVSGSNPDCGTGPGSTLPITFYPPPQVSLSGFDSICYNEPSFPISGGTPPGGEYTVNGSPADIFDPASAGTGNHQVIYKYTDSHGCKNADSATVFVRHGRECEIVIWVPNAFTPDGDGVNDIFRPVSNNIRQFSMKIYNRYGQLVFTSSNPENGWDGTFHDGRSPEGNYIYIIVYQSSFAPPENTTLTGNVVLVR
ncbi:MAG: gliding motility-associated C-terminal domain-containing protein [Bacteroidetes bacterium]|nr:gliding motility-associated C-terminal domain-containing protein [Bacteroidota bacterium]